MKVLVLAPHTDDGELGCGGTIARFLEEGKDVYYAAFSTCEKSVPEGFPKDILTKEVKEATGLLGIKSENLFILDFEVRIFPQQRQEILDEMIKLRQKLNPDLVLIPSPKDVHQDHNTIAVEAIRAFKKSNILGYEVPWNDLSIENNFFIGLEEKHIQKKIDALKAYKSQYGRSYVTEEFIKSLSIVRGVQSKNKYAETFEMIRWYI